MADRVIDRQRFSVLGSWFCPRRIAIFRALFLGDLLCSVPAFRALRHRFPDAEITLIGLPWMATVVPRFSYVDRLLIFPGYAPIAEAPYDPPRTAAFLAEARAYGYDLAIQMHGDGSNSNSFVADLRARVSLGYRRGLESDERLMISLPYDPDEHETLRWLRLVGEVGAATDDPSLEFPILPREAADAGRLLESLPGGAGPLVGVHAGAKDAARRWPPLRFAAVADQLAVRFGARIVLTGSADERPLTAAVRSAMRAPALELAGHTDLGAFAALIGSFDLLLTNDTGASHLAAATRTPSVVLFGQTRPSAWAPLDRTRHYVIDAARIVPDADPVTALHDLPVAPVLAACEAMLERSAELKSGVASLALGA